jgi:hypothetical protein
MRVHRVCELDAHAPVAVLDQVAHALDGREPAFADDPHAVADALDLIEVVGG